MYSRFVTTLIQQAMADTPAVILHGARQTGKTTLARHLASDVFKTAYYTLDDLNILNLARQDPAGFIKGLPGTAVLDEVQRAPDLLLAIKASIDRDRRPGRFLLTGSANILQLPRLADTLAGRIEVHTIWPLSQGEILERQGEFIDLLFGEEPPAVGSSVQCSKSDLYRRMIAGGYPEVLGRARHERRRAWFSAYLQTIMVRDVQDISKIEGLADMPRLLAIIASRAGGLLNYSDLARDAGLNQQTLRRYFDLLRLVFLVRMVQPWFSNRGKRLTKSEKVYLGDTGLLGSLLNLPDKLPGPDNRDFGPMLENFVALELIKQADWSQTKPGIFHFRELVGQEVDFVLEAPGGRKICGVEVKASATIGANDLKGMNHLREAAGEAFHRGVILYTGEQILPLGKDLFALPVSSLWESGNGVAD